MIQVKDSEIDNAGRIIYVSSDIFVPQGQGIGDHSVCNVCKKDMFGCWDIVCKRCNKTFCYDHAKDRNGFWFCPKCYMLGEFYV